MKTTWVIAAALLLVAAAAMDTSARGRGGKGGFHGYGKKSGHKSSLVEQLGLTEDQQTQIQTLRDTLHEQKQTLREEYWTDVEALLTNEQLETLEELKANRGPHKDSLVEQLGLTEDQQTQIEDLREDLREEWQALREEFSTDFEAVLTADQLATFEELKTNRGCHSKDSEEDAETTETAAAGKATAVEETSWGRVKDSFGR